ncbi:tyrosine--tRNA ligase [Candidatus Phytoplasma pruni]|uniref:Tyrosine--tRNA ligase n=1 Tax=Candidatus Phytoplasma pruni TaxID=479893 RepID=A0A851HIW9_9MOLU|nr:tyrosine--tRNA ligase [Candidatus Phytoplasma pruni]NWN45496.1 tyrosine--tRNA ligase [Candidatus Phytoplasma pruni]
MLLFQELKWRNLIKDCSDEKRLEEMLNNETINFYCGFDPTGNSLTVGHLVQITTILLLQQKGHVPFILIGQATGLIGDPKETEERNLLSKETIYHNVEQIQKQLTNILSPHKVEFVNNYDWISQIDLITFFRTYGKLFNVNYMIAKDTVAKRLKTGISYSEFSYMILQALDFHQLYKHKGIKLQMGGSDQWGNITSGLELIRKLEKNPQEEKPVGMSIPLLLNSQGVKFGKSEKNTLWLDQKLTSPYQIYQYFLNTADNDVVNYLKTLTLLKPTVIMALEEEVQKNPQQRKAQKELAKSIVTFLYGEETFQECFRVNEILFSKKHVFQKEDFALLQKHLVTVQTNVDLPLVDALAQTQLTASKNEAKKIISSGSVKIFKNPVKQVDYLLSSKDVLYDKYVLLTKKNKFKALIVFN